MYQRESNAMKLLLKSFGSVLSFWVLRKTDENQRKEESDERQQTDTYNI